KALIENPSERILGFSAFGAEAGEIMASVQIAMIAGLPYTALRDALFAHPTMAEGLIPLFSNVSLVPGGAQEPVSPTLATGGVARLQVVCDQVGSSKGLPYISSSCLALSRGGDCSGRANFNCPSKSFWSAS